MREGRWQVQVRAGDPWTPVAWQQVVAEAKATSAIHASKHATTYRWRTPERDVYVKVYHSYGWPTVCKDLVRPSKAAHVRRISARLAGCGVAVPEVLAVGEERRGPIVLGAWLATAALAGAPVAEHVAQRADDRATKWTILAAVGTAVARLHEAGFTAGDLVPTNVWIVDEAVVFLDHDRTVAGRWASSWWRARRNLVQLNRIVLPRVTATDRLRVYRAYAHARGWGAARARRRLGWVVRKTIQRRRRFDGVSREYAARSSFRELMRAPSEERAS